MGFKSLTGFRGCEKSWHSTWQRFRCQACAPTTYFLMQIRRWLAVFSLHCVYFLLLSRLFFTPRLGWILSHFSPFLCLSALALFSALCSQLLFSPFFPFVPLLHIFWCSIIFVLCLFFSLSFHFAYLCSVSSLVSPCSLSSLFPCSFFSSVCLFLWFPFIFVVFWVGLSWSLSLQRTCSNEDKTHHSNGNCLLIITWTHCWNPSLPQSLQSSSEVFTGQRGMFWSSELCIGPRLCRGPYGIEHPRFKPHPNPFLSVWLSGDKSILTFTTDPSILGWKYPNLNYTAARSKNGYFGLQYGIHMIFMSQSYYFLLWWGL